MKLGFTGTRDGMTTQQREAVAEFLRVNKPISVHHGDCIGADSEFHDSVLLLPQPTWIETHPCTLTKFRAYRKADVVHPVKPPKDRNKDIVRVSEHLLELYRRDLVVVEIKCRHCGYRWVPRVPEPRKCPECQKRWPLKK